MILYTYIYLYTCIIVIISITISIVSIVSIISIIGISISIGIIGMLANCSEPAPTSQFELRSLLKRKSLRVPVIAWMAGSQKGSFTDLAALGFRVSGGVP